MKKRETRLANIYHAAAEMICRKGYDATTLGEIAEGVGLTKAGLYHYFPSKEELLFRMVNYALDRVDADVIEPVRGMSDPAGQLRAITANYVTLIVESGGYLTGAIEHGNRLRRLRARKVRQRRKAFYNFVRGAIQRAKDNGSMPDIDVSLATLSFFGVILYLAQWYRPDGSLTAAEVTAQIVQLTVDRMLLGLAGPGSGAI